MSDWKFLELNRVTKPTGAIPIYYVSDSSFGFNGMFRLAFNGQLIRCIASDGMGWKHVSVSCEHSTRPPSWAVMCFVKSLFWDDEDWVVQFHPAKSEYVNYHEGCLHLWEPTQQKLPTPASIMVGPKRATPQQAQAGFQKMREAAK